MYNDGKDGAVAYNYISNGNEYTILLKRGDEVLDREIVSTVKDGENGDDSTVAGPRGSVVSHTKIQGELFTTSNYTLTGDEDFGANNKYNNGFDIPDDHDENGKARGFLWESDNDLSHKAWSVLGYRTMFEVNGNTIAKGDTNIVTVYNYTTEKVVGQIEIVYIGNYTTDFNNVKKDDFLFDVKLHVHGDAVIDKTLSVGALSIKSDNSDNEVQVIDGKLYATNINATDITTGTLTADRIVSSSLSKVTNITFSSNDSNTCTGDVFTAGTNDSNYVSGSICSVDTFNMPENHSSASVICSLTSYGKSTGDEYANFKSYISSKKTTSYIGGNDSTGVLGLGSKVFIKGFTNLSAGDYTILIDYDYKDLSKIEDQQFRVDVIVTTYR